MAVDDEIRALASPAAEPGPRAAGLRPVLVAHPDAASGTGLILFPARRGALPSGSARCLSPGSSRTMPRRCCRRRGPARCCPSTGMAGSPAGLSGHRPGNGGGTRPPGATGAAVPADAAQYDGDRARVEAADARPASGW